MLNRKQYHYLAASWQTENYQEASNPPCAGWLTFNGNILLANQDKFAFFTPEGKFIREVTAEQGKDLSAKCPLVIVFWPNQPKWPETFPVWHFVESVLVTKDYTNYKESKSNNGGNYSFFTYHDWYVAQYPDGKWRFAMIESYRTSSEFLFDELKDNFETKLSTLHLKNTSSKINYLTEVHDNRDESVLEEIGCFGTFRDLWFEIREIIPSRWGNISINEMPQIISALSISDKKRIIQKLKNLGVTKTTTHKNKRR